ncbi:MAG: hypothetical protein JWN31_1413 [Frankiales bacterium]|nr:hypothetical protein [Frankiales bacterium]
MRLRPALVVALSLSLAVPVVSHAAVGPLPDPLVAAQRDTEAVVMHGSDFPAWARPGNVTAKLPFTDLNCVEATGATCAHNHYATPEVDTKDTLGNQEARVFPKVGRDVRTITGWRWDGSRYVEVPFQVDEVFTRYLDNSNSGFAVYSGEDQHTTYAFDREGFRWTQGQCVATPDSPVAKDPVPGLDTDDELAFMAADTGSVAPSGAALPSGVTDVKKVSVLDPLTRKVTYLYVMLGRTPSFNASNGYVHYQRDADANAFEKSQSSYSDYGNAAVGTYCDATGKVIGTARRRPKDTATVTTDRYRYRYDGRWLMTDIRISPDHGVTYGPDLVDRWKARAFQQDAESKTPCCGYEEEDTNWGGSSTLLGERTGPVRAIRETWGADSGTNVVRRETFYRNEMTMKTWLRVHVIPPLDGIYAQWDYNAGRMTTFRSNYQPNGVPIDGQNDDALGNLDDPCNAKYDANGTGDVSQSYRKFYKAAGLCDNANLKYHQSIDLADPTFGGLNAALQWGETSGPWGTIVDRYTVGARDLTPGGAAQSLSAQPYYRDDSCFDDATGTNPGPRLHLRSAGEPTVLPDGTPRTCWQPSDGPVESDRFFQGDIGTHGVHLLFLVDSDNARQTVPVDEIVVEQRQVFLPGDPGNVGEEYGRSFEKPLIAAVAPV